MSSAALTLPGNISFHGVNDFSIKGLKAQTPYGPATVEGGCRDWDNPELFYIEVQLENGQFAKFQFKSLPPSIHKSSNLWPMCNFKY